MDRDYVTPEPSTPYLTSTDDCNFPELFPESLLLLPVNGVDALEACA